MYICVIVSTVEVNDCIFCANEQEFKNSFTKATEVSILPSTSATIVESSAYLNYTWKPSYVISRSIRKILKR